MSDFDTFDCANCGESFKAYPDSNAAEKEACSPACETAL